MKKKKLLFTEFAVHFAIQILSFPLVCFDLFFFLLPFFILLYFSSLSIYSTEERNHQYLVRLLLLAIRVCGSLGKTPQRPIVCISRQNFYRRWAESRLIPRVKMEVSRDFCPPSSPPSLSLFLLPFYPSASAG